MLECRACVSRVIRAIGKDTQYATGRGLILTPHWTNIPHRRRLATAVEAREIEQDALSVLEPIDRSAVGYSPHKRGGQIVIANEKALRKELEYLKDPVKLAEHVQYVLRCEQPDRALDLCRLASKDMTCIVSWNHVVSWHMGKGQVSKAMDVYNEMKKRGQFPDSYTYMRLLKGFADNPDHTMKAVSIYNSMSSPTSRVKPSIMHTNAALRVCALSHDMDALWGIVSKIPEYGTNAPDAKTYTTILQAIRHSFFGAEAADPALMASQRQEAVNEGRRIWQEIIAKWRAGDLIIDETLVVAMADLLLISRRLEDLDDVLNLVLQTTRLERLIAPLGSPDRNTEHVRLDSEPLYLFSDIHVEEDREGFMPTPSSNAFKPVAPPARNPDRPRRTYSLPWVRPGNGILSVLVRACQLMRTPKTANLYWDTLTSPPYNVIPDIPNFHAILNLLRINRSAARTAHVIQHMHNEMGLEPQASTYILAMRVCHRDHKNPNIVDIATDIVDDMEKHLLHPDNYTLELYLSVALTTNNGPKIIKAVNRLLALTPKLRDASDLIQAVIGSIDTLLRKKLVPDDAVAYWRGRRTELDALLSASNFKLKDRRRTSTKAVEPFERNINMSQRDMKLKSENSTRIRDHNSPAAQTALKKFRGGNQDVIMRRRRNKALMMKDLTYRSTWGTGKSSEKVYRFGKQAEEEGEEE